MPDWTRGLYVKNSVSPRTASSARAVSDDHGLTNGPGPRTRRWASVAFSLIAMVFVMTWADQPFFVSGFGKPSRDKSVKMPMPKKCAGSSSV